MYTSLQYCTKYFHYLKNSLCSVSSSLLHHPSPNSRQLLFLFAVSVVLPFPECHISSVQSLSLVWLFATLWTAARQASLFITNSRSLLKLMSIELVMPSSHLILCHLLLLPSSISPSIRFFSDQFFISGGQNIGASASVLQWIFRTDFLEDWLLWSPCSPRDSQESSPTPQFKSINSSVLSSLYSPTLASIHDYWKKHSID